MNLSSTLTYTCPHCNMPVDVIPHQGKEIVNCPVCNKPFQVTVPEAKPAEADQQTHLVLPSALDTPAGSEPCAGTLNSGEPKATSAPTNGVARVAETLEEKEEPVRTVHLDIARRYPVRCLLYLIVFVAGIFVGLWSYARDYWLLALLFSTLGILALLKFTAWWLRTSRTTLALTSKRCILETGLFTKQTTEVPLPDISEVSVSQSFLTRMLHVGDVTIVTRGGEKKQIVVMAVPDPQEVAALIRGQGVRKEVPVME
jgi:membrane protein YdbS with pleckstrin-like domain